MVTSFLAQMLPSVAGGKMERRNLSSLGILAEGSNWPKNSSGGPECVSVKTGTLSRKSLVCGQPVGRVNTRSHPAAERKPSPHSAGPHLCCPYLPLGSV